MKKYEYIKDGGLKYPVEYNDIWTINNSILSCTDIDTGKAFEFFKKHNFSDVAYVDPPWGQGNANTFRGKAGLEQTANFSILLKNIINILKNVRKDVFIEMGRNWNDELKSYIREAGGKIINEYNITYYKKKPCILNHCTFSGKYSLMPDLNGLDDDDTPFIAIEKSTKENDVVLDCCTGRGLTFVASVKNNRRFLGTELSPNRASVSLRKIKDITGQEPVKIKNNS